MVTSNCDRRVTRPNGKHSNDLEVTRWLHTAIDLKIDSGSPSQCYNKIEERLRSGRPCNSP
jgi:hypothetical protein